MDTPKPAPNPLAVRLMRGAALTGGFFVFSQALRFGSNLILARLLFPDAFGLMALVTMVMVGLVMLSDAGIQQSILYHKRGDDPDFLNTAFSMNAVRGLLLWLLACGLGWPLAQFYDAPELLWFLPFCGLTLLFHGLSPTRVFSAERNILLGRILGVDLLAQLIGILVMITLAFVLRDPWALAWGVVVTGAVKLALEWSALPGLRNQWRWERNAARDLFQFGGWIILSSGFGFLLAQGDRAILGRFLQLEQLGLYNIAWFLAAFPTLLLGALSERLLIPAYRETFADTDPKASARLKRLRRGLTGGVLALLALAAALGPWLIDLLYDDRYALAGPTLVLIACALILPMIGATYDQAALARGDSRRFFRVIALRALVQTALFTAGLMMFGLPGALAGQTLAAVLVYPALVWLARINNVWDPLHDAGYAVLGMGVIGAVLVWHAPIIALLLP